MNQNVSNSVQEYRNTYKTTQEDLGKVVGVTRQTIIAIEKGNYTPSVAKHFNTTVEKLFTIEK